MIIDFQSKLQERQRQAESACPWFIKWYEGYPIITLYDFNQLIGLKGKRHKKFFSPKYFKPGVDWNGLGQGSSREEFERENNVHYEEETFAFMYLSGAVKALNILQEENKISPQAKQAILASFMLGKKARKDNEVRETKAVYELEDRPSINISI